MNVDPDSRSFGIVFLERGHDMQSWALNGLTHEGQRIRKIEKKSKSFGLDLPRHDIFD